MVRKQQLYFALIGLITVGCTHVQVVGFDKKEGTVSIFAKRASMDMIQAMADEHCGSRAELLSMGQQIDGSRSVADFAGANTSIQRRNIYNFSCPKGAAEK